MKTVTTMLDLTRRGLFGILAGILTTPLRSLWPARKVAASVPLVDTADTIVYDELVHMWKNNEAFRARNTYNASIENITWDRDGLMKIGGNDG